MGVIIFLTIISIEVFNIFNADRIVDMENRYKKKKKDGKREIVLDVEKIKIDSMILSIATLYWAVTLALLLTQYWLLGSILIIMSAIGSLLLKKLNNREKVKYHIVDSVLTIIITLVYILAKSFS